MSVYACEISRNVPLNTSRDQARRSAAVARAGKLQGATPHPPSRALGPSQRTWRKTMMAWSCRRADGGREL
eukprot:811185-Rhodomonas_salina.7